MTERPRRLTDMWSIRIDFSLGVSFQKYLIFTHWGRGYEISKHLWHKDRRPLKRAISQNSQAGTLKSLNYYVRSHRYHVSNVGM